MTKLNAQISIYLPHFKHIAEKGIREQVLPVMLQDGSLLLHDAVALHVRVASPSRVYPVSQLNVATDRNVVPLE